MESVVVAWIAVTIACVLCLASMAKGRRNQAPSYQANALADQINRIIEIESGGDPACRGPVGERGLMQIRRDTWADICEELEVAYNYDEAFDPAKNIIAGTYYWDTILPRYLHHYGLPDTPYLRLAAYNWGIGNVTGLYRRHGRHWFDHLPAKVQRYCLRWRRARRVDYVRNVLASGVSHATSKKDDL